MKVVPKLTMIGVAGVVLGFTVLYLTQIPELPPAPSPEPLEKSQEQLAEEGWMTGCVRHTLDEAQKVTDVIIDEKIATIKARRYCQCDWDYLVNNMGLSLEDIASIGQEGSRGSSAIVEAQNYCYEQLKNNYY